MYNNENNHYPSSNYNGNHPYIKPTLEEYNPSELEQDNSLESSSQPLSSQAKNNLQQLWRFYIILIVTGLILGGIVTWGLVTLLNEWEILNPPKEEQINQE